MRNRWFRLALGIALLIDIPCSFFIPIDCDVASGGTHVEWTFLWEFETDGLFFGDPGVGRVLLVLVHAMICCTLLVLAARSIIRFVEETY